MRGQGSIEARMFIIGGTKINWVLLNPSTTDPPTTDPLTTDQPTTDHLLIDPPTHRTPIHRPTDAVIIFKRLKNSKIFTLQNINTAGKI